jgi:hypothetical protein
MFMPFHALWVEDLFLLCHSAPALSVAIWVCSIIKAAWLDSLGLSGVVCPLYIHARILFLLHGAIVEVAPYRSGNEEGKGCLLV